MKKIWVSQSLMFQIHLYQTKIPHILWLGVIWVLSSIPITVFYFKDFTLVFLLEASLYYNLVWGYKFPHIMVFKEFLHSSSKVSKMFT